MNCHLMDRGRKFISGLKRLGTERPHRRRPGQRMSLVEYHVQRAISQAKLVDDCTLRAEFFVLMSEEGFKESKFHMLGGGWLMV